MTTIRNIKTGPILSKFLDQTLSFITHKGLMGNFNGFLTIDYNEYTS
jgi:hypothetical protein